MKSIRKRFQLLFDVILFMLLTLPLNAKAYENDTKIVEVYAFGPSVKGNLDSDGVLTITGSGKMYDFTYDKSDATKEKPLSPAYNNDKIRKVVIYKGVKNVGENAFRKCRNLNSVVISGSVEEIKDFAFICCYNLSEVTLSNGLKNIGMASFSHCNKLTSIVMPDTLKSITYSAFYGDVSLEKIDLNEGLVSIHGCFGGCVSLKELNIPSTVTDFYESFWVCDNITKEEYKLLKINVAKDNSKYCSVNGILYSKDRSILYNYPPGKTGEVYNAPSTLVKIFHTAFAANRKLKEINLPASISDVSYSDCTYDSYPAANFGSCSVLENININSNCKKYCSIDGVLFSKDKTILYYYPKGKKWDAYSVPATVNTINVNAIYYNNNIKKLYLPDSVKVVKASGITGCSSLETIRMSKKIEYIGHRAFSYLPKLKKIVIPKTLMDIDSSVFEGCVNLQDVYFYCMDLVGRFGWVSELELFSDCSSELKLHLYKDSFIDMDFRTSKLNYKLVYDLPVVTLKTNSCIYTGSEIKPTVIVKDSAGNVISATNYTICYSNNIEVGKGKITVSFKNPYLENVSKTFKIVPKTTTIGTPAIASDGITVKWTKNTTGAGYYIYRSVNGAAYTKVKTITSNATVSWKDTTAKTNGNKYQYKIIAYKTVSGTTYSSVASAVKTTYFLIRPTVTLKNTLTGVKVAWGKNVKATGYYVYRSTDGGKNYSKVKTITSNATVSFTDTAAKTNGSKYMYKIVAYKTVNGTTYKSATSSIKTMYFVSRPAISSATNSAAGKLLVKWARNAKTTGYQIQYSTSSSFTSPKTVTATGTSSTISKTIASLTKGKTYYVRIRSYKTVGSTKFYSAWSASKSVKITK